MYVTDKLIYLQLEKTGCSHTARLLDICLGGSQDGKHIRMKDNPEGKLVVGSIRNPWDWYVSLWAFGCGGEGAVFQRVASRPWRHKHQIKEWLVTNPGRWFPKIVGELTKPLGDWRSMYADVNNPELFRKWLRMLLDGGRSKDIDANYAYSPVSDFAGFQTFRYAYYF